MPSRIDPYWEEKVRGIKANNRRWGEPRIWKELQQDERFEKDGPSQGWVASFLRRIKDEDLTAYRLVHWPETFERGDLPWEASAATLELLALQDRFAGFGRPTLRLARWFWRVTMAAPDLPAFMDSEQGRWGIARLLAAWETLGKAPEQGREGIEWYLAYAPWRDDSQGNTGLEEWKKIYGHAVKDRVIPGYPDLGGMGFPHTEKGWQATAELGGEALSNRARLDFEKSEQEGNSGQSDAGRQARTRRVTPTAREVEAAWEAVSSRKGGEEKEHGKA